MRVSVRSTDERFTVLCLHHFVTKVAGDATTSHSTVRTWEEGIVGDSSEKHTISAVWTKQSVLIATTVLDIYHLY